MTTENALDNFPVPAVAGDEDGRRAVPARLALLRSPAMRLWPRWSSVTTTEALAELLPGDDAEAHKLRALATGLWLDTGSPPSRMTFWMQTAVFGGFQKLGAGYPVGGPQEMALSMVEAIEARGGSVFVRAPVAFAYALFSLIRFAVSETP